MSAPLNRTRMSYSLVLDDPVEVDDVPQCSRGSKLRCQASSWSRLSWQTLLQDREQSKEEMHLHEAPGKIHVTSISSKMVECSRRSPQATPRARTGFTGLRGMDGEEEGTRQV